MVRAHARAFLTGDGFGSLRCDCGPAVGSSRQKVVAAGRGIMLYLRQEGRGIGLLNKVRHLQDQGATVEADEQLGFAPTQSHVRGRARIYDVRAAHDR
ncbi:MAG: hypothetical protein QM756_41915 [Polyangiaceae bacterium]